VQRATPADAQSGALNYTVAGGTAFFGGTVTTTLAVLAPEPAALAQLGLGCALPLLGAEAAPAPRLVPLGLPAHPLARPTPCTVRQRSQYCVGWHPRQAGRAVADHRYTNDPTGKKKNPAATNICCNLFGSQEPQVDQVQTLAGGNGERPRIRSDARSANIMTLALM
jgi:hypothetical protein